MTGALRAALALLVAGWLGCGGAWAQWAVPEADARLPLGIQGDLHNRDQVESRLVIDFNDLLGAHRTLAAGSLSLVDGGSGESVPLQMAEDAAIRYASGNPILRLSWTAGPLAPFQERDWQLYMRTVPVGDADAWQPLEQTFTEGAEGILMDTSFEEPDPERPDRPAGWSPGGVDKPGETTERVWTDTEGHTGAHCLKIARTFEGEPPSNSNRPFWWSWPPSIQVRGGQSLRLSGWLKTVRIEQNSGTSLWVEFRDQDGGRLQDGRLMLHGDLQPGDWKQVSGSTTAPVAAASAVVWFSVYGSGEAYCDDVTVTTVPGASLPDLPVQVGALQDRAAFAEDQAPPTEGKVLRCGIAQAPPKLDGVLDDPCWQSAGRVSDFEDFLRVPGTEVKTTVLACADRQALYFGFECTEPDTANLLAAAQERDGPLWQDDSVELFLDTNLDRRTWYQIIVNSRGVFFDQDTGAPDLPGAKWNGPIEAAAHVYPDRWTAEVRLEFTGLRLAEASGQGWGANFARSSFRGGRSCYTWARVGKNFGEPSKFGSLVLPFDPTAEVVTGRPLAGSRVFWGEGPLPFEVNNRRDRAVQVRVVVSALTADGQTPIGQSDASVGPRSATEVPVTCSFEQPGEVELRYDLLEEPGDRVLYTTSLTHTVPDPLDVAASHLVSYLGEGRLIGTWTLGVAEEALAGSSVAFSVAASGSDTPVVTEAITPEATAGTFSVGVADLPAGTWELRADLVRD
ncbi:MAG TPA: sugar-binding protein, partial [Armatimonadota bacterium]|nr:sugar-binding protein [Armatimonadota bacterium]